MDDERKQGRAGRPPGKRQPHQVSIYLSDEELERVAEEARRRDRPVSWIIRRHVRAGLGMTDDGD